MLAGDTLLLEARPAFVTRQRFNRDFLLINDLQTDSPRHERAWLAGQLLDFGTGNALLLLILCYVVVSLLTEIVTNNAAALIMLPIVLEISDSGGFDREPFVFAVMMAASASFATPLGYQTNLMVYGPGAYRFSDFLRVGAPMNIWIGIVSLVMINLLWPLNG